MSAQATIDRRKSSFLGKKLLSYPDEEIAHSMVIHFVETQRGTIFRTKTEELSSIPDGAISLPIPTNLTENFRANYNGVEMGSLGGSASKLYEAVQEGKSFRDVVGPASLDNAVKFGEEALRFGVKKIAKKIDPALTAPFERFTGAIFNPHLANMFQGVPLRQHSFSWRMSPQSKSESSNLRQIIEKIRNCMLPTIQGHLDIEMGYPNECFVHFFGSPMEIFPVFRSVVSNLTINHAAAGTPVFFAETGLPAEFELTIEFQEIEVITRNDFTGNSGTTQPETPPLNEGAGGGL